MKKLIIALAIATVVVGGVWRFVAARATTTAEAKYQFVEITRGNLENVVSGTGALSAVGTVDVGTQVSGTIEKIFVDYNDRVKKGQLLAVLDTDQLEAAVRDAEANVGRFRAQYEQALSEHNRNRPLADKGFLSEKEFTASRTSMAVAKASYQSAQASLDRARTNLKNAEFRSPIDGAVIQRNVEAGQTVAASLQAPTLFVIAENLSHMEILGLVDESDIGQIREGQEVRFTVQAYPDETFSGTVRQIRLKPQTIQNVVNYTVVINAENQKGLLLPGMTATVDFVVKKVENVLLVPNAALRFQPSQDVLTRFREDQQKRLDAQPDSVRERRARMGGNQGMQPPADVGSLWYLGKTGKLARARVRTGATDGLMTEIVMGRNIEGGMRVISGTASSSKSATASNQSNTQRGLFSPPSGGRPPRF